MKTFLTKNDIDTISLNDREILFRAMELDIDCTFEDLAKSINIPILIDKLCNISETINIELSSSMCNIRIYDEEFKNSEFIFALTDALIYVYEIPYREKLIDRITKLSKNLHISNIPTNIIKNMANDIIGRKICIGDPSDEDLIEIIDQTVFQCLLEKLGRTDILDK